MSRAARRREERQRARQAPAATVSAAEAPEPADGGPWTPIDSLACLLAALVPFSVYRLTLSPTVNGGDSGELLTVSHVLGVAHPPGYPLYTMLGWLLSQLPLGGPAERVNLLSALAGAGAAALLYAAVRLWTGRPAAGVLAAGAFAFAPLVWAYAIEAEVFALNNLFAAGLLFLSVRLARAPRGGATLPLLAAFGLGLGLTNHHTLVLFGLPFVAWLFVREWPQGASPVFVARFSAAFLLGLLPYLYLPWAASRTPRLSWGDPASWSGFFVHLLRREYGTFRLAEESAGSGGQFFARLGLFAHTAADNVFFVALLLAPLAFLTLRRRGAPRVLTLVWLAALAFYLLVFCSLANVRLDDPLHLKMQSRFWQQPFLVVCAFLGVGLAVGERALPRPWSQGVAWTLALALPTALGATHFGTMKAHANRVVRDYGEAVLRSVPEDSLLVISSDEAVGSVRYLQEVEGLQPRTRVVPAGQFTSPWFRAYAARRWPDLVLPEERPGARARGEAAFSFRELLDANRGRFPVYVCNRVPWLQSLEEAYALWPAGLVERVRPKGEALALVDLVSEAEASFARFDVSRAQAFPPGTWEEGIADAYWKQYDRLGLSVAGLAARQPPDPASREATARVFEALASGHPSPPPAVFKNLGVAYRSLADTRPDATAKMLAAWKRYLVVAPATDPDLPNVRALVEQAEAAAVVR